VAALAPSRMKSDAGFPRLERTVSTQGIVRAERIGRRAADSHLPKTAADDHVDLHQGASD
jgi:hypothetical protein